MVEAPNCIIQVMFLSCEMPAGRCAGSSTTGKNDILFPGASFHLTGLKEFDGQKWNVAEPGYAGRLYAQITQILFVHGIMDSLKMEQLERNLIEGCFVSRIDKPFKTFKSLQALITLLFAAL